MASSPPVKNFKSMFNNEKNHDLVFVLHFKDKELKYFASRAFLFSSKHVEHVVKDLQEDAKLVTINIPTNICGTLTGEQFSLVMLFLYERSNWKSIKFPAMSDFVGAVWLAEFLQLDDVISYLINKVIPETYLQDLPQLCSDLNGLSCYDDVAKIFEDNIHTFQTASSLYQAPLTTLLNLYKKFRSERLLFALAVRVIVRINVATCKESVLTEVVDILLTSKSCVTALAVMDVVFKLSLENKKLEKLPNLEQIIETFKKQHYSSLDKVSPVLQFLHPENLKQLLSLSFFKKPLETDNVLGFNNDGPWDVVIGNFETYNMSSLFQSIIEEKSHVPIEPSITQMGKLATLFIARNNSSPEDCKIVATIMSLYGPKSK